MKKVFAAAGIASLLVSTTALGLSFTGTNVPKAGVVASKHNMNLFTENAKDPEGRVCAFCHTPHHALSDTTALKAADYLPLWSHKLTTAENFVPYFTPTVNVSITNPLSGPTMLCMSCHDGVIAVDEHYNDGHSTTKLSSDRFGGGSAIGLANYEGYEGALNLSNDHPVGFLYAEAIANHPNEFRDPGSTYQGGTRTISQQLTKGVFTCATCHDVHNKDNVVNTIPGATKNNFLLGDMAGSMLCLSCHIK